MKKKAEKEKAKPPNFGNSILKQKKDGDNPAPSNENKNDAPPEEVKTIEVSPEEIKRADGEEANPATAE